MTLDDLMDELIASALANGRAEYVNADRRAVYSLKRRLQGRCKGLRSAQDGLRIRWSTPIATEGGWRLVGVLGPSKGPVSEDAILAGRIG